jgi:hypothetical protein
MRPPEAVVVVFLSAALAAAAGAAALWDAGAGSAGLFPLRNRENIASSSLAPRLGRTQTIVGCARSQLRHSSGLCAIVSAGGVQRGSGPLRPGLLPGAADPFRSPASKTWQISEPSVGAARAAFRGHHPDRRE